jgi:RHS repeat-associated protein
VPFLISPLWNERGQAQVGVFHDGGMRRCLTVDGFRRCVQIIWPETWFAYHRPLTGIVSWHGSLLEDKQDAGGTLYRRSRYYDPATGRFTQEDPIGLAGGLNLYGFAAGDPVSYSDPYGLAVCARTPGLRRGIERAVGAFDIPWGTDGCIRSTAGITFVGGRLDRLRRAFLAMVVSPTEHNVMWDNTGSFTSHSTTDGKDIRIVQSEIGGRFYWGFHGEQCPGLWASLFQGKSHADYDLAGIIAHEIGHIAGLYDGHGKPYGEDNATHMRHVFPIENLYHAHYARPRQVLRCVV